MTGSHTLFVTCPSGLEALLADELRALGATVRREVAAGVQAAGSLETAYRICLWSRLASRVLLELSCFSCADADALYAGVRAIDWLDHLSPEGTLAVGFTGTNRAINNTRFGLQRVKDAVVDQLREASGTRPGIDRERPDLRLHVHLHRDRATLSIDLAGQPLHRRGYRAPGAQAPLKENLAAAILLLSRWPAVLAEGRPLVDPMCGSGTLVIEAALMAGDIAPGLRREYFGFLGWRGHEPATWSGLRREAEGRAAAGSMRMPYLVGSDRDGGAVETAVACVRGAGLTGKVTITRCELADVEPPTGQAPGLVVTNPPYGQRLGGSAVAGVYAELGRVLRRRFTGWRASVFTGNPDLLHRLRLPQQSIASLYNGAIASRLVAVEVPERAGDDSSTAESPGRTRAKGHDAEPFANRLRKNLRGIGRWARREGVGCFRLYDADMPEFAVAIDIYGNAQRWVHVQEYAPPRSVDAAVAEGRLRALLGVIPDTLDVPRANVFLKRRQRQRGSAQYEKLAETGRFHQVREYDKRFLVNFEDYLDTGLFLDHRPVRRLIGQMAHGSDFLNLFAYTGTATVYAAAGGARSTTTVDMSRTYLDWARRNLELNATADGDHRFVQADCLRWITQQAGGDDASRWDLIFLDPPTYSSSKRMEASFDVQRDHVALLRDVSSLLRPGGTLIFSTNRRGFRLESGALPTLRIEDITEQTIPRDFSRNRRIHSCFRIRYA